MRSNQPIFRHLIATATMALMADAEDGSAVAAEGAEGAEGAVAAPAAPVKTRASFTQEQIAEIRSMRAERHPAGHDKEGQPVYSHAKLAAHFGTTAGSISQIVRNRTYKNPEYTPVNDGN